MNKTIKYENGWSSNTPYGFFGKRLLSKNGTLIHSDKKNVINEVIEKFIRETKKIVPELIEMSDEYFIEIPNADLLKIYYLRESEHIKEDLKRGWSSWNFGQDGITATKKQMEKIIQDVSFGKNDTLYISGFNLNKNDLKTTNISELHKNYWVLVDEARGIACSSFFAKNDEQAIKMMNRDMIDFAEGEHLPINKVRLIKSKENLHLFTEK